MNIFKRIGKTKGFSLIGIIIVISILAFLIIIVMPKLSRFVYNAGNESGSATLKNAELSEIVSTSNKEADYSTAKVIAQSAIAYYAKEGVGTDDISALKDAYLNSILRDPLTGGTWVLKTDTEGNVTVSIKGGNISGNLYPRE